MQPEPTDGATEPRGAEPLATPPLTPGEPPVTTWYAFLVRREGRDRHAWATIYHDRALAEAAVGRVSAVVPVAFLCRDTPTHRVETCREELPTYQVSADYGPPPPQNYRDFPFWVDE